MSPLVAVFTVAVVLGTAVSVVVLGRARRSTRLWSMTALVAAPTLWSACGLVMATTGDAEVVRTAYLCAIPAFGATAAAAVWYALDQVGSYRHGPALAGLLALDPVVMAVVGLVPQWRDALAFVTLDRAGLPEVVNGPMLYAHAVAAGTMALGGGVVLVAGQTRAVDGHRGRFSSAALAFTLPTAGAMGTLALGLRPVEILAVSALGFVVALLGWAVRVLRRPEVNPVAVRQVLGALGDAVVVVDEDGTVVQANPAALALEQRWGADRRPWSALLDGGLIAGPDGTVLDVRVNVLQTAGHRLARVVTARDVTEVEALRAELADLAERDGLTGLHNRRYLDRVLPGWAEEAARGGRPLAAAMIDLDHFKQVNDRFGHAAGDRVLIAVAGALSALLRGDDVLVRFGGEELLALLPGARVAELAERAERWRATCAAVAVDGGPAGVVTVSIGLAEVGPGDSVDDLLRAADAAMYAAKAAGRDRVVTAEARTGPRDAR